MIITGSSGSGKTQAMMHVLRLMHYPFTKYKLFIKDVDEPIYKTLIAEIKDSCGDECMDVHLDFEDLDDVNKISKKDNTLIICDDLICNSASDLRYIDELFIRGRKRNASVIFITQDYFDKNLRRMRKNISHSILKYGLSGTYLKNILRQYIQSDDEMIKAIALYKKITKNKDNFLLIDANASTFNTRFRRNLDSHS